METFNPEKTPWEMLPEEEKAEAFVRDVVITKIPDLLAVIQFGSTITGKRTSKKAQSDIDILIFRKDIIGQDHDVHERARQNNIHLTWFSESALEIPSSIGGNIFMMKEYKVLYGPDVLKTYQERVAQGDRE